MKEEVPSFCLFGRNSFQITEETQKQRGEETEQQQEKQQRSKNTESKEDKGEENKQRLFFWEGKVY